ARALAAQAAGPALASRSPTFPARTLEAATRRKRPSRRLMTIGSRRTPAPSIRAAGQRGAHGERARTSQGQQGRAGSRLACRHRRAQDAHAASCASAHSDRATELADHFEAPVLQVRAGLAVEYCYRSRAVGYMASMVSAKWKAVVNDIGGQEVRRTL